MGKATITAAFAALALAMPLAVSAQQPSETGAYVGGGFGQTKLNDFCSDVRSIGVAGGSCDETDSGWKAYVGYRVNRHLAIEGSYIDWGSASVNNATFAGLPTRLTGEATSFGIAALGILPVGERFSLFAKAGFLLTEAEVEVRLGGAPGRASDDQTELHFGFGATFNITRNLALRGEWERAEDTNLDMMSIGLQYRF